MVIYAGDIFAQDNHVDMADTLRADGKIFVVVAVLCIVFAGIIGYLIAIDFKINRAIENQKKK